MRRLALVCAVVTAAFAGVVAVGLAATGHRGAKPRDPMVATRALSAPGAFAKKLGARSLKSALRQRRHLATAAATTERDESKTAFSAQGEDAAFATLDEAFPEVLKAAPEPIASSDRVVKYVNNEHGAIVSPVDENKASRRYRGRADE